jgi:hypothetical protein
MTELLELDPQTMRDKFGREPFVVHHRLSEHPLLELESIAELADFLPPELVEHNLGEQPQVLDDRDAALPRVDDSPGAVARGIETNGSWMVLKEIEHEPRYAALLNESLDEVEEFVADLEGTMRRRQGFIFLSAPGSVTPVHIDTEHNLLLQIRGTKQMNVGTISDAALRDRELERLYTGGATRYLDARPEEMTPFDLVPGLGISVPHSAPHWVKNGDAVSISLSITFQTPQSERIGNVYAFNARLRKLRISPRGPNGHPIADRTKALGFRAMRAPARLVRRLRGA